MTIPSFKILKKNAAERVAAAEQSKNIVLIYTGTVTALALLVTVINYVLNLQIAQLGGLSNMGLRSVLSTVQSVLPVVQSLVIMALDLGYIAAMLRIARQQYASPQTLKLGFDRFFVLLRYTLIQGIIYGLAALAAFWISMQIFLVTPLSNTMMSMLSEDMLDPNVLMGYLQDPVFSANITTSMVPLLLIFSGVYLLLFLPICYSMRMAKYVIIDKPGMGTMYALRESRKMMKGSCIRLFKLDVSLWWWYAITLGSTALCYGDALLPMAGISLPFPATVSYFLF